MRTTFFILLWFLIVALAPVTIYLNTPWANLIQSPASIANSLQRIFGLVSFILLFIQLMIGFNMDRLKKYFGDWVYNFHIIHGVVIYLLIVFHGLSFVYFNYVVFQNFDPFYIFIDVCVLCVNQLDHYYNLGRIGFWFITIAVFAGLFRGFNYWMRKNWRNFHYLNYLAFLIIGVHAYFVGTDTLSFSFKYLYILAMVTVLIISIKKLIELISPKVI